MPRRAFLTLVLEIGGNVNADGIRGNRIAMKKVISWNGDVRAFVSPRCIRRSLRRGLSDRGFRVDPLILEGDRLWDVGDPVKYVDDDLFGYLTHPTEGGIRPARNGPVKVSPLIALHHTEIGLDRGGRFPRSDLSEEAAISSPEYFEIETARWLGSMHIIIEERVGRFTEEELSADLQGKLEGEYSSRVERISDYYQLTREERASRIESLMRILLKEGWTFPRGSEAPHQPKFHYAVVILSESFIPMPNVLRMTEDLSLDQDGVRGALRIYDWRRAFIVDYRRGMAISLARRGTRIDEETMKLPEGALDVVIEASTGFLLRGS